MNFLILINNAPNYINFFQSLGNDLEKDKHNVFYAIESRWPEIKQDSNINSVYKYYFTDYNDVDYDFFEKNKNQFNNLRKAYFPTFDRHFHYKFNLKKDESMDEILLRLVTFYKNIIKENEIDAIIYENVSNAFSYSAYLTAKIFDVKYLGLITSRIPGRFEIWNDLYGNIEKREEMFTNISLSDIPSEKKNIIIDYINEISEVEPDYMKNNPTYYKQNYIKSYLKKLNLIIKEIRYINNYKDDYKNSFEIGNPMVASYKMIKRNIKRMAKIKILENKFDNYNFTEDYFLFPLHFQPESSTSVNAMEVVNQYELIKNIAFNLPIGVKLFVKEHPNAMGFPSLKFYEKLKQIPNIKYISPNANNKKLIINSKGVITISSTMGYEALLMEKPVITFGNVFYNYHPYCYFTSYGEIGTLINRLENLKFMQFRKINIKFLDIYIKDSYENKLNFNLYFSEVKENILNRIRSMG